MSLLDRKISLRSLLLATFIASTIALLTVRNMAATPGILSYQGRVLVNGAPYAGNGQFKFALVNAAGTTSYWSNDGTSAGGSQPTAAVQLAVSNGLYSVLLGDTTIGGMTLAIPASAFDNADVRLRIWFNDGTNGSKLLTPDQRIAPVGYAQVAKGIDDGAVTPTKIASLPKCHVFNNQAQSVPNGTQTFLTNTTNRYDTDGIHPSSGTRLTCHTAGIYRIFASVTFSTGSGGNNRSIQLTVNGVTQINENLGFFNNSTSVVQVYTEYPLSVGDYVELSAAQNSGSTLTVLVGSFGMSYAP